MSTILITGANGFIGSHLVTQCQKNGFEVLAGIREGSDLSRLSDLKVPIVPLNYLDGDVLKAQFQEIELDYLIHVAGVTQANSKQGYHDGNCTTTKNLLAAVSTSLKKFVLISSLAARGPGYHSIDTPISPYGKSKLEAESLVRNSGTKFLIIRPTAVYGPGDLAFFPLFRWAKKGVIISLGNADRKLSFIHVADLCRLILGGLKSDEETIYASDGKTYSLTEMNTVVKKVTGRKRYIYISISSLFFKMMMTVSEFFISTIFRSSWKYPKGKVSELVADDWSISANENMPRPSYNLEEGFQRTLSFYKHAKWL